MFLGLLSYVYHSRRAWSKESKDIDDYIRPIPIIQNQTVTLDYTGLDAFLVLPYSSESAVNIGSYCANDNCRNWYTTGLTGGGVFYVSDCRGGIRIEILTLASESDANRNIIALFGYFSDGCSTITSMANGKLSEIESPQNTRQCYIQLQRDSSIHVTGMLSSDQKLLAFDSQVAQVGGPVNITSAFFAIETQISEKYQLDIEFLGDGSISSGISNFKPDQFTTSCLVSRIDFDPVCLSEGRWAPEPDSSALIMFWFISMIVITVLLALGAVVFCIIDARRRNKAHKREARKAREKYACRETNLSAPREYYDENGCMNDDVETPQEQKEEVRDLGDNPYDIYEDN